jgi:high-affinity nickel-transport protein
MLIILGVFNLKAFTRSLGQRLPHGYKREIEVRHGHYHHHGDYVHNHAHGHGPDEHGHAEEETPTGWLDLRFGRLSFYQGVRPFLVGIIHGMAGSAAVALLILPIIQIPLQALAYLLVFGAGTIAGMLLITATIALPFVYSARRSSTFHRHLGFASSSLSVGFGLFLVYQIGFVQGLFRP